MDIIWLQRDFGLYIVNLFDTYHASHALELNGHGLAYLLNYYCDLQIDKKYQLADWRIRYNNNSSRPLPQEMIDYARSDTHYLLYVYDLMRNELIRRGNPQTLNLIMTTLSNSANTSKKIHEKEIYDAESGEGNNGWKQALRKFGGSFEIERVAVFKTVHQWRDTIARQEDENIRYVLPNHMLCRISDSLPDDVNSLLSSCGTSVPPLLKVHAAELLRLIKIARLDVKTHAEERAAEWKQIKEEQAEREREWQEKKKRGPVHTRFQEVKKEDESNAKSNENNMVVEHAKIVLKKVPSMNIFGDDDDKETESRKKARLIHESLILEAPTMESLENESMHESKRVKLE